MKKQTRRNKYYHIKLTALFSFGVVFFSALASSATGMEPDSSFEYDTARPGSSYKHFALSQADPALCQEACIEDTQCMAWTYVKPKHQGNAALCWLKNDVPDTQSNSCCISGGMAVVTGQAVSAELTSQERMEIALARLPSAHVWEYIDKFGDEPDGYAAYSYILSGRDGSDKYTELVKSIQSSTPEAGGMIEHISPQELNLFLIPTNKKGATHEPDYQTSKALLTILGAKSNLSFDRPGPYIITLARAFKGKQFVDILYTDLTNVHKGAVPELVRTYKQTVLEENIDGVEKLSSLRLSLLNLAFLAEDSIGFAKTASASLQTVFQ